MDPRAPRAIIAARMLSGPGWLLASAFLHASWNAREPLPRRQLAGAVLVLAGAALVAWR